MAELTGGHLVARTLRQAGVRHVFTLCGGHILPIYDGCLSENVAVVDVRHEQAAAHAGDAYARLTRGIGVALVVPGPGVTDAVTGVANAYAARSPLLLIGGAAPLGLRGLGALQETEQVALLRPITKGAWSVAETRQIPEVLTTAIRTALSGRPGPVFVEIPVDLLLAAVEDRLAPIPTGYVHRPRGAADPDGLALLETLLVDAERPVVMAGGGVYWDDAAKSLALFAERAGAPVFMNGAGRGVLGTDHPNAFFHTRGWALGHADVVLVLGTPLDFRLGYGRPPTFAEDARVAMIDVDPVELGRNRPLELGISGDIDIILRQLVDALPKGLPDRVAPWLAELRRREGEARGKLDELAATDARPISHYRWAREIAGAVTRDTIVVGDGGDVVNCVAKFVPVDRRGSGSIPARSAASASVRRSPSRRSCSARTSACCWCPATAPSGSTAWSWRRPCGSGCRSRASSATTAAGARSAAHKCRSSARRGRWPPRCRRPATT